MKIFLIPLSIKFKIVQVSLFIEEESKKLYEMEGNFLDKLRRKSYMTGTVIEKF